MNVINYTADLLSQSQQQQVSIPKVQATQSAGIDPILNIVFGLAGLIAILMVVIGGFQYVIAQGEAQKVAKAKNTILYAIVGLVLIMSSYAIVGFVIDRVMK